MGTLRNATIRLAYRQPNLREHLLPLLKQATVGGSLPTATDALIHYLKKHPPVRADFLARVQGIMDTTVQNLHEGNKPPREVPDWMRPKKRTKKVEPPAPPKAHVVTPVTPQEVLRRFQGDARNFPLSGLDEVNYGAFKTFLLEWLESICRGPSEWLSVSMANCHHDGLGSSLEVNFRLLGEEFGDNPEGVELPARTYEREIDGFLRKSGARITYEHSGMRYERAYNTIGWVYEYRCVWDLDVARIVTEVAGSELGTMAQAAVEDPRNNPDL